MQEKYLYGIIGLLGGILIAILFASSAVNSSNTGMMRMMGMNGSQENMMEEKEEMMSEEGGHGMGMGSSMEEMTESLEGKTGEAFDEAFIDTMIIHHQGAIDMAKVAQTSASHQEIKDLAEDIITAQTSEIQMMQGWKTQWGY